MANYFKDILRNDLNVAKTDNICHSYCALQNFAFSRHIDTLDFKGKK